MCYGYDKYNKSKCSICDEKLKEEATILKDGFKLVQCSECGEYKIEKDLATNYLINKNFNKYQIATMAAYLFNTKDSRETISITKDNFEDILNNEDIPKNQIEKINLLLIKLSNEYKSFSDIFNSYNIKYKEVYADSSAELEQMLKELKELGYLSKTEIHQNKGYVFTLKGYKMAYELVKNNTNSKKVFVAMGFKPDLLEAHKEAIKPACSECGYDAKLITEQEYNDGITDNIIANIKSSKFVIVDFTYNNLGAYFEAGFAQGRGLKVIRTCKKEWFDDCEKLGKDKLHFDVRHYNFIMWNDYEDLKNKLINRIKAVIME